MLLLCCYTHVKALVHFIFFFSSENTCVSVLVCGCACTIQVSHATHDENILKRESTTYINTARITFIYKSISLALHLMHTFWANRFCFRSSFLGGGREEVGTPLGLFGKQYKPVLLRQKNRITLAATMQNV